MRNKKVTVTVAELNTGNQIMVPCAFSSTINSTPKHFSIKNGTGKLVEVNVLGRTELADYRTETSTGFIGIGIANGDSFSTYELFGSEPEISNERIDYLLVKKTEAGDATAVLDIYCVDYI